LEIIVVSGKRNKLLTFSLRFWIVVTGAVAVAAIVIAFVYNLLNVTVNDVDRTRLTQLIQENDVVRDELKKLETEVQGMNTMIDSLETYDTRLRTYALLEPVDESIKKTGTTGAQDSAEDFKDLRLLSPLLDNLLIRAESQSESYKALLERVGERTQLRDHTPSIVPVQGWFVSGYGYRLDPFTGTIKMHEGIDLAGPVGSPIVAPASGTVQSVVEKPGFGLTIEINHGYGYTTFYAHCQRANVTEGSVVKRGDIIAFLGDTGKSTGPHLHYEVRVSGVPVNPLHYILTSGSITDQ
jgi:murein DD-endopeptidase MepM/ murein hydrolase activator NlpD